MTFAERIKLWAKWRVISYFFINFALINTNI